MLSFILFFMFYLDRAADFGDNISYRGAILLKKIHEAHCTLLGAYCARGARVHCARGIASL